MTPEAKPPTLTEDEVKEMDYKRFPWNYRQR